MGPLGRKEQGWDYYFVKILSRSMGAGYGWTP